MWRPEDNSRATSRHDTGSASWGSESLARTFRACLTGGLLLAGLWAAGSLCETRPAEDQSVDVQTTEPGPVLTNVTDLPVDLASDTWQDMREAKTLEPDTAMSLEPAMRVREGAPGDGLTSSIGAEESEVSSPRSVQQDPKEEHAPKKIIKPLRSAMKRSSHARRAATDSEAVLSDARSTSAAENLRSDAKTQDSSRAVVLFQVGKDHAPTRRGSDSAEKVKKARMKEREEQEALLRFALDVSRNQSDADL